MGSLDYHRQNPNRDKNLLKKIRKPLTKEEYLANHPDDADNVRRESLMKYAMEKYKEEQAQIEQELTDEEYDNIYYSQEDDTVDETYDGDYNPYGHGFLTETSHTSEALNKRQNEEYDIPMPEDFNSWSGYAKGAWLKKHTIRKED